METHNDFRQYVGPICPQGPNIFNNSREEIYQIFSRKPKQKPLSVCMYELVGFLARAAEDGTWDPRCAGEATSPALYMVFQRETLKWSLAFLSVKCWSVWDC